MNAPDRHDLESLSEGTEARLEFTIREDDMKRFGELSGDWNPLHCDAAFARAAGFEGPVVYGGLLVAQVSRMIGMHLPGRDGVWSQVQLDFRRPLYVGQPAELVAVVDHRSEAARSIRLRLEIRAAGQRVAKGSASVALRDPGGADA